MKGIWDWLNRAGEKVIGAITGTSLAAKAFPSPSDEAVLATGGDEAKAEEIGITFKPVEIPVVSDLVSAGKGIVSGVTDTIKNLPLYVFIAIGFIGVYLILMGRKGKSVL